MRTPVTIIGIDCATAPERVGMALGEWQDNHLTILAVTSGRSRSPLEIVIDWLTGKATTLLAMDAPLGWPAGFGVVFPSHQAGMPIEIEPNHFFRRYTDSFIHAKIGKLPLDVGADRIARTAHAALQLMDDIGRAANQSIGLAWSPEIPKGVHAIEIYPAATLKVNGMPSSGYKNSSQTYQRQSILDFLAQKTDIQCDTNLAVDNADCLDAMVCLLAGCDFLNGEVMPPDDEHLARKEGWIWVRSPA
jgi:predicted nuclease with RNAse H fold